MSNGNKQEPMRYYKYDRIFFLAKRGKTDEKKDIYVYHLKAKTWGKYSFGNPNWIQYYINITRESQDISKNDLKEAGVPLLQDE